MTGVIPSWVLALVLSVLAATATVGPAFGQSADQIELVIEPSGAGLTLGESLDLQVRVTNGATVASDALVIHLDITDPARATSVDPEDWTSTLSQPVGVLDAGASVSVDWTIQPISGGTFAVYAVALAPASPTAALSNIVEVDVTDRRTLNPGGILPVAVGTPAILGGLLFGRVRRAKRGLRDRTVRRGR